KRSCFYTHDLFDFVVKFATHLVQMPCLQHEVCKSSLFIKLTHHTFIVLNELVPHNPWASIIDKPPSTMHNQVAIFGKIVERASQSIQFLFCRLFYNRKDI